MGKEFEERVIQAANRAWDYIADDCFVDDWGRHNRSVTYTWKEVVEMAVDANRMQMHGGLSKEDEDEFYKMSRKEQNKIMRKAFKSDTYGY